jgi:hypothetical protein
MSDCSSHDQAIPVATDIGIVRQGTFDAAAFERAIADLLGACGLDAAGPHMGRAIDLLLLRHLRLFLGRLRIGCQCVPSRQ